MYHNSLLEEIGDYKTALEHLDKIKDNVTDKRGWKEKRAFYLKELGHTDDAKAIYQDLLSENPHNRDYVKSLLALEGLLDEKGMFEQLCTVCDDDDIH